MCFSFRDLFISVGAVLLMFAVGMAVLDGYNIYDAALLSCGAAVLLLGFMIDDEGII